MVTNTQNSYLPNVPDTPLNNIARFISKFLGPPILGLVSGIVAALWSKTFEAWLWAGFFVVPAVLIPTLYVFILMRQGKVTDFDVFLREQRWRSYLMSIGVGSFLLTFAFLLHAPLIFLVIGAASLIQTIILFLVNMRWKISAHCASAAGFAIMCWRLWEGGFVLFLFLIPIMIWSRVILLRHTFWQSVFGASLGAFVFYLALDFII